jgi:hypothetical protein
LESWQSGAKMGYLYRACFPSVWRSSKASPSFVREGDTMTEREREFLMLLEDWFPICIETEGDLPEWRPAEPPGDIRSVEFTYDEDRQAHGLVANVLFWLSQQDDDHGQYIVEHWGFVLPTHVVTGRFDSRRFGFLCNQHANRKPDEPWSQLPLALKVVSQSTGSPFLDAFTEDTFGFDQWLSEWGWTLKGLREMRAMGTLARNGLHALAAVNKWLTTQPERWNEVFQTWANAHGQVRMREERIA